MTGPEHYAEAERLLVAHEYETSEDALAAAQVHATLALAAAFLVGTLPREFSDDTAWRKAALNNGATARAAS